MCGIAGLISYKGVLPQYLKDMSHALRHRGPDGFGYMLHSQHDGLKTWLNEEPPVNAVVNATVGFAHRRLSIIDLSTSSLQPMVDETNSFCLVYNGEIYNYLELKAELEKLGHEFRSRGDAEVLLRAYKAWGTDCFRRLNGMWALALLDRKNRCVVFSRDRFGIKPLYYTVADNMLYFASEIKALLAIPAIRYSPNAKAVAKYLLTGVSDDTEETFFEGIRSFPAAHWASVPLDGDMFLPKPFSYWSFPEQQIDRTEQEAVARFRELFIDAIRLHAQSDVQVGTCLSGGMDSSSVVFAAELLRESNQIPSYSHQAFGYIPSDEKYSERRFMDAVVSATLLNMHIITPTEAQVSSSIPTIIRDQDEPFGSASILAQWFVFQKAKEENIKVMLDGQGADESLAGYHTYFKTMALKLLANRDVLGFLSLRTQYEKNIGKFPFPHSQIIESLLPNSLAGIIMALKRLTWRTSSTLKRFMNMSSSTSDENLLIRGALSPSILCVYSVVANHAITSTPSLNLQLQQHVKSGVLPVLLRYEDRNSMAHSIEARVPFLDYRLIDFVFTLPDEWKINGIWTKYILREAMKGILPESIRTRTDKIGFRASPSITFNYVRDNFASLVQSKTDLEQEYLNQPGVERLFANANKSESWDFVLWRFLNLKLWLRQHFADK